MKPTKLTYHKVYSLPNFQNEKIGIDVEIDEADNVSEVFNKMKVWCDAMHEGKLKGEPQNVSDARHIIANEMDYTGKQVLNAKEIVIKYENEQHDDLPF